jgi:hypothetical protein
LLDFSAATLSPAQAWARVNAGAPPDKTRLGMFDGRPIYRFVTVNQGWVTIFADSGETLAPLSAEQATEVIKSFAPETAWQARFVETIAVADQWTLSSALKRFKPLHKFALEDAAGTHLYVSQVTGEVVMKTTLEGRFWGWPLLRSKPCCG